jgi:UDP-N-acetylmuramate dehydrogenase
VGASIDRAEEMLRSACGDRLRSHRPLAPLTSFRIGGSAALYVEADGEHDLAAVARVAADTGVPVAMLGRGSNVLVSDDGFEGIVLRLGPRFRWAERVDGELSAGGAMPLPALAGIALSHGLAGLEFGVAIPATLGGAVRMNAGAHGHEMAEVLSSIDLFDLATGAPGRRSAAAAGFRYRGSALPASAVIVGATVRLAPDRDADIRSRMDAAREWRRRTQPLAEPNCGSVFKNPPDGSAARLIEAAGAKELRVGGASVSAKHANFIVASPGCRADDVVSLIDAVKQAVRDRFGVELETEVQLIGDFSRTIR